MIRLTCPATHEPMHNMCTGQDTEYNPCKPCKFGTTDLCINVGDVHEQAVERPTKMGQAIMTEMGRHQGQNVAQGKPFTKNKPRVQMEKP